MRIFHVASERFDELPELPAELPRHGFLWIGSARREFEVGHGDIQAALQRWELGTIVDLHLSDLVNHQLPSHFDYTSWYDLMVFRRLAASGAAAAEAESLAASSPAMAQRLLQSIDTSPVGFAVFDRVLVTVHPTDCAVREHFSSRYLGLARNGAASHAHTPTHTHASGPASDMRGGARLPTQPADLMLRMVNHMVDGYLDLRRLLTRHLGQLQQDLLDPKSRFNDWGVLLESRNALHQLEDTCEDQRSAVQEWIDALDEWPDEPDAERRRERELLRVRSRDVLEHIERVLGHVRRLEQSAETVVQMHFSALSHRTNDIMRTLTVLTAIFLPLNLITGFFGMNFEFMPLIHTHLGFWLAVALMVAIGLGLAVFFRRKRYLGALRRR